MVRGVHRARLSAAQAQLARFLVFADLTSFGSAGSSYRSYSLRRFNAIERADATAGLASRLSWLVHQVP